MRIMRAASGFQFAQGKLQTTCFASRVTNISHIESAVRIIPEVILSCQDPDSSGQRRKTLLGLSFGSQASSESDIANISL